MVDETELGVVAAVHRALQQRIVEGQVPAGARLNLEALARELGTSPTPVREAMQRLERDGLVAYVPAKGYATTSVLDRRGLTELFEFRLLIEPWAARGAARESLANPAAELERELARFRGIAGDETDVRREMLAHDTAFHDAIMAAAGNDVVRAAYQRSHCHLHSFRLYPADLTGEHTVAEHEAIARAIRECRADEAEALMTAHIQRSFERSARAFDPADVADASLAAPLAGRRTSMVRGAGPLPG